MSWYRKKPVTVQAIRLVAINGEEASFDLGNSEADWLVAALEKSVGDVGGLWVLNEGVRIGTLEGTMRADEGDYIVRGTKGELYPVKPDIFASIYEPVDGP